MTASEVTATTATISWVIAFIVEQQDFIVYYGTDENSLDLTSDIVTSSDDTSLTDQEYDVTLTGLTLGTTYYYQVVANYSNFRLESEIKDFTTLELGKTLEHKLQQTLSNILNISRNISYSTKWFTSEFHCHTDWHSPPTGMGTP